MVHVLSSRDALLAGTGWADQETLLVLVVLQGRTGRALLICYAIGNDTIGSSDSSLPSLRQLGCDPSRGAGQGAGQLLCGRDLKLTCVCSRTCVSIGPDSSCSRQFCERSVGYLAVTAWSEASASELSIDNTHSDAPFESLQRFE
jgi:hypothetical protein